MMISARDIGRVKNGISEPLLKISAVRNSFSKLLPRIRPINSGSSGTLNTLNASPINPNSMKTQMSKMRLLRANEPTAQNSSITGARMYTGVERGLDEYPAAGELQEPRDDVRNEERHEDDGHELGIRPEEQGTRLNTVQHESPEYEGRNSVAWHSQRQQGDEGPSGGGVVPRFSADDAFLRPLPEKLRLLGARLGLCVAEHVGKARADPGEDAYRHPQNRGPDEQEEVLGNDEQRFKEVPNNAEPLSRDDCRLLALSGAGDHLGEGEETYQPELRNPALIDRTRGNLDAVDGIHAHHRQEQPYEKREISRSDFACDCGDAGKRQQE